MLNDKIRIQKGLTRLDSRTKSNRMALKKDKCKSTAIRSEQQAAQMPSGETGLINSTPEKSLGALHDSLPIIGQWCEVAAKKQMQSNPVLGGIKASALSGTKRKIMLSSSASLWVPHFSRGVDNPCFCSE